MLTFIFLIITLIVIGLILAVFLGTGGILIFLIFGDLIIGIIGVVLVVRAISRKKKNKIE